MKACESNVRRSITIESCVGLNVVEEYFTFNNETTENKIRKNQEFLQEIYSEININKKVDGLLSFDKLYNIYKEKFVEYGVTRVALTAKQIHTKINKKIEQIAVENKQEEEEQEAQQNSLYNSSTFCQNGVFQDFLL